MKQLKRIYQYLQQRYGEMWSLTIVCFTIVVIGIPNIMDLTENLRSAEGDKYLTWIYICNLLCLTIISTQLLRLDCRQLLSRRTANILDTSGYLILLLMILRHRLEKHVTGLNLDGNDLFQQDTAYIYLLGFLLIFISRLVLRAVKIKEEQDLTI
ncbi:hypothetical protein EVD33_02790 [Bacteroidales bacterium SW292]|nr:hypothetical protein [Bacteroidales bacterium SW292]